MCCVEHYLVSYEIMYCVLCMVNAAHCHLELWMFRGADQYSQIWLL